MNMVYFIRHGLTAGNEKKRYIGKTDEPLSEQGSAQLKGKTAPRVDVVAVSPMLRCMQTAQILYPRQKYRVVEDFRECDFGTFEGKNYLELSDDPAYKAWIDSNGKTPFRRARIRRNSKSAAPQRLRNLCSRSKTGVRRLWWCTAGRSWRFYLHSTERKKISMITIFPTGRASRQFGRMAA